MPNLPITLYYSQMTAKERSYIEYMGAVNNSISSEIEKNANKQITANVAIAGRLASEIDDSMVRIQTGIQTSINKQTSEIVASNNALGQIFQHGFNELNNTLDIGFSGLSNQLGYMGAAFSCGLDRISDTLKGMSKEICDKLDAIHDIVNNPLLTQSRELFRRAIINYNKGFFEESLEDIKSALDKYKTDYMSWFLMGKLLAFGVGEFSNVINLEEAINAFIQAAKYNSPNIPGSKEARFLSAEIYFYLGTAQYSQSNELSRVKKELEANEMLGKALKSFERSFSYSDKMYESLFNSARCKVLQGQKSDAINDLEKLVLLDRNYCLKVFNDTDFLVILSEFRDLINKLKHDIFINEAEPKYNEIIDLIPEFNKYGIPTSFTENLPYFDIMDYNLRFGKLITQLKKQNIEPQYNKLLNRKKSASSYSTLNELAKEFRLINYKDSTLLADECEKFALEAQDKKYQLLLSEMKTAKSENEFQSLYRKFLEMNGYKKSNSLAEECLERYQLEEQHRKERQRQLEEQHKKEKQSNQWIMLGLCRFCGGQMSGIFTKKCKNCGNSN